MNQTPPPKEWVEDFIVFGPAPTIVEPKAGLLLDHEIAEDGREGRC